MFPRPICCLLLFAVIFAQDQQKEGQQWKGKVLQALRRKLQSYTGYERPPKNVIFFLGDGMGIPAISAARIYKGEKLNESASELAFSFEEFPYSALIKTNSYDRHVTDSAASAVALFCGYKVDQEMLGTLPGGPLDCSTGPEDQIHDGIAELAVKRGLSAGFVTTDKITGATPGATYAKGIERTVYSDARVTAKNIPLCQGRDIASQLLQFPAKEFKVLMGGGSSFLLPTPDGERQDGRDISQEWRQLGGSRFVLNSTASFDSFDPKRRNSKVLGLFAPVTFPYHMDEALAQQRTVPRLREMTEKAVKIMERDNSNGYFLMIEGGLIDLAEHINQMKVAAEELFEFDDAVRRARELTDPSETLILVTADHSHSLSLPGYLRKTDSIFSSEVWSDDAAAPQVPGLFFAVGPGAETPLTFTAEDSQNPHFVSPAAIPAGLGSHGGEDVGLWASGPYSWLFSGSMENAEVAHLVKQLLCLYPNRTDCVLFNKASYNIQEQNSGSSAPIWIAVISLIVALLSTIVSLVLLKKNSSKIYT